MKLLYQVLGVACGLATVPLVNSQCSSSNTFVGYNTWDIQKKLGLAYQDAEDLFYQAFQSGGGSGSFQDSNGGNLNFRAGNNGFTVTSSCGSNFGGSQGSRRGGASGNRNSHGNRVFSNNAGYSGNSGYNFNRGNYGSNGQNRNFGQQNFGGSNLKSGRNSGRSNSQSSWSWSSSSSFSSNARQHGGNQGYDMGHNQAQNNNYYQDQGMNNNDYQDQGVNNNDYQDQGMDDYQPNDNSNQNMKSANNMSSGMSQGGCGQSQGGFCDYSTYCIEDVFGVSNSAAHSLFNTAFGAGVGSRGTWRNQETGQAFQFECFQDGFQAAPLGGGC